MIVRDKPSLWDLLFAMRGSIVPRIAGKIAIVAAVSIVVLGLREAGLLHISAMAALPFSLIGIALSIFAGFRNSACYDRWWEGRKVWGQMIVDQRSLVRESLAYCGTGRAADMRPFVLRSIGFAYALRDHLRGKRPSETALSLLPVEERTRVEKARNPPNLILQAMSQDVAAWLAEARISDQIAKMIEDRIVALSGALAASERLKSAPVPYTYSLLLHRTAYLFCLLLPFGLAEAAGGWAPLAVALVSYTFFGLDALGDELETPFGSGQNALPLDAMARVIEIGTLELLGDTELPADLAPVNFILT